MFVSLFLIFIDNVLIYILLSKVMKYVLWDEQ